MRTGTTLLAMICALSSLAGAERAFAWGCGRSVSRSGANGGSVSHTGYTSGGYGYYNHSGSTTYTSPSGQTYLTSHSGSGTYYGTHGYAYGGPYYYGAYGDGYGAGMVVGTTDTSTAGADSYAPPEQPQQAPQPLPQVTYVPPGPTVYTPPPAPAAPPSPPPPPAPPPPPSLAIGTVVTTLPASCMQIVLNKVQYINDGTNWYKAEAGPKGTQYVVTTSP